MPSRPSLSRSARARGLRASGVEDIPGVESWLVCRGPCQGRLGPVRALVGVAFAAGVDHGVAAVELGDLHEPFGRKICRGGQVAAVELVETGARERALRSAARKPSPVLLGCARTRILPGPPIMWRPTSSGSPAKPPEARITASAAYVPPEDETRTPVTRPAVSSSSASNAVSVSISPPVAPNDLPAPRPFVQGRSGRRT